MPSMTIEFSRETKKVLNRLARQEGVKRADIFHHALVLYNYVMREAREKGLDLVIIDRDGNVVKKIEF